MIRFLVWIVLMNFKCLDSEVLFYFFFCRKLFQNFISGNFGQVYFVNNKFLVIIDKTDVCIKTSLQKIYEINYILNLKKNFIFIGQLDNTGYRTMFGQNFQKSVKGVTVVVRGIRFKILCIIIRCLNMIILLIVDSFQVCRITEFDI